MWGLIGSILQRRMPVPLAFAAVSQFTSARQCVGFDLAAVGMVARAEGGLGHPRQDLLDRGMSTSVAASGMSARSSIGTSRVRSIVRPVHRIAGDGPVDMDDVLRPLRTER